jgi:SAM-dependent methyltransferase
MSRARASSRSLIDDQIRYYRSRAAEYDATSVPDDDPFAADAERIRHALRAFAPRGRVLELACGTGQWTGLLADLADEVTAVDAAPEMLAINAAKNSGRPIRYLEADLFRFTPDGRYDAVFFAFWLSHVPMRRFTAFWELVRACLATSGRVFFADERRHGLWTEERVDEAGRPDEVRRRLLDGSEHRLVKVLWTPARLARRLRSMGWNVSVQAAGPFYWGSGQPRD